MNNSAFSSITLPSGLTLNNRIVKAAMEENLATSFQYPSQQLMRLYQAWSAGGSGLLITGNVMIDHLAMTGPGGVALEEGVNLTPFRDWASAAKSHGSKIVMQINHPGRQVFKNMGGKVLSPSDVALDMGKHSNMFSQPTPMTEQEINDVITRFATTAKLAQQVGFDGVEIHAAHGYLISQFLSPLTNLRQDKWGGSIENRARLLIEVIKAIKNEVSESFSLSVKLNSADFQRGGFDIDDAISVIKMLNNYSLDFVELSGGSYEAPAMQGISKDDRTLAREAYFLTFAEQIAQHASMPLMITGGIKRLAVVEQVIASGIPLVGIASALAMEPNLPNQWQKSPEHQGISPQVKWQDKVLSGLATMAMIKRQLARIGKGKQPLVSMSPICSIVKQQVNQLVQTKRYKKQYKAELN